MQSLKHLSNALWCMQRWDLSVPVVLVCCDHGFVFCFFSRNHRIPWEKVLKPSATSWNIQSRRLSFPLSKNTKITPPSTVFSHLIILRDNFIPGLCLNLTHVSYFCKICFCRDGGHISPHFPKKSLSHVEKGAW